MDANEVATTGAIEMGASVLVTGACAMVDIEDNMDSETCDMDSDECDMESEAYPMHSRLDRRELTAEEKSRMLAGATLNDINLLKRALMDKYKATEHHFLDRALLISVSFGHAECVDLLIKHGANAHTLSEDGTPCWLLAVKHSFHSILSYLLNVKDLDVNATDTSFNTGLHLATLNNDVHATELLLKSGTNPNLCNGASETALIMASKQGNVGLINALLSGSADPYVTKFNQRTGFHIAVEYGHIACVKEYMSHNIDIYHYDSDGRCALHMASDKGFIEIVRLLLRAGTPANILDHERKTPLYEAVSRGHIDVVGVLVAAGAQTDIQNSWGNTPIMSAVLLGQVDVLRLLLKLSCNVNKAGFRKMTSLHCSALYGQVECTNMLLRVGADPNAQSCDGYTPAHFAVKSKNNPTIALQTLRLLLHINADLEIPGVYVNGSRKRLVTPFELALCIGVIDVACWLALAGANMKLVQDLVKQQLTVPNIQQCNLFPSQNSGTLSNIRESDPMVKWLLDKAATPKSLMELSRGTIRKQMGLGITGRISAMGLPRIMQEYIVFKDMCENPSYWFRARNNMVMGYL